MPQSFEYGLHDQKGYYIRFHQVMNSLVKLPRRYQNCKAQSSPCIVFLLSLLILCTFFFISFEYHTQGWIFRISIWKSFMVLDAWFQVHFWAKSMHTCFWEGFQGKQYLTFAPLLVVVLEAGRWTVSISNDFGDIDSDKKYMIPYVKQGLLCKALKSHLVRAYFYGLRFCAFLFVTSSFSLLAWVSSIVAVLLISLGSLVGILVAPFSEGKNFTIVLTFLIAIAVSTLLGDALLHLFPHVSFKNWLHNCEFFMVWNILTIWSMNSVWS